MNQPSAENVERAEKFRRDHPAIVLPPDPRDERIAQLERELAEAKAANDTFRNRLTRIVTWIEENEPSLFSRGIWDAAWGSYESKNDTFKRLAGELVRQLRQALIELREYDNVEIEHGLAKRPCEWPDMQAAIAAYDAAEESFRPHTWKTQRRGGDPTSESSYEMVTYCTACGLEPTGEDAPPCEHDAATKQEQSR